MSKETKIADGREFPLHLPAELVGGKEFCELGKAMLDLHNQKVELAEVLEELVRRVKKQAAYSIVYNYNTCKEADAVLAKHKGAVNGT